MASWKGMTVVSSLIVTNFGVAYHYYRQYKMSLMVSEFEKSRPPESHRIAVFDQLARTEPIDAEPFALRERHFLTKAKGNVLEIAAGTGTNLEILASEKGVTNLTAVDKSGASLEVFKKRIERTKPPFPITLIQADAHSLSGFLRPASFDTVIGSFALCSLEHPVVCLQEMKRVLQPDGLLLILDRGVNTNKLVSRLLSWAQIPPDCRLPWDHGFYADRDIGLLVNTVFAPNVTSIRGTRKVSQFPGAVYQIEASRGKGASKYRIAREDADIVVIHRYDP